MNRIPVFVEPLETSENYVPSYPLVQGNYDLVAVLDTPRGVRMALFPHDKDENGAIDLVLVPVEGHRVARLDAVGSVRTSEHPVYPLKDYRNCLEVRVIRHYESLGLTHPEIAKKMGCATATLYRKKQIADTGKFPCEELPDPIPPLSEFLPLRERSYILGTIKRTGGREIAAACLGISIATLYRKLGMDDDAEGQPIPNVA